MQRHAVLSSVLKHGGPALVPHSIARWTTCHELHWLACNAWRPSFQIRLCPPSLQGHPSLRQCT